jgi:hypothetical protein
MSIVKKVAGLAAGLSAVAVIGVAVAQGVPPNPYISNPALGAGQQSSHLTSMGETGVPWVADEVRTAEVAPAPVQQPAPVAAAEPAPAPAQETQQMGAAPEPAPVVEEQRVARADRG